MMCCLVCRWSWGGVELLHRPCDVLSCMSVGLGWGAVTTDHVMCCLVCLWGWGEMELLHRPCDVLSCMSVGLG